MIIGSIAFAATAIEFPGIMRELIAYAQTLPAYLSSLGISDSYMVWVDILLSGDKLVLLGFILATRIVFAIITSVVGPIFEGNPSPPPRQNQNQSSVFSGWGKAR